MKFLAAAILAYILLQPSLVFALSTPVLISPQDSSFVTTPILNWQTPEYPLYPSNPYRVQVDEDSAFASPNKDYYTSNTSYSPNLTNGLWYWRVRSKDSNATISDWSSVWSFTLSPTAPTLSPTPTSQPTTTPTPTPSPDTSSAFNISPDKSSINSDDILTVTATITGLDLNTKYFLKGAFRKDGSSNYFGLTRVSGDWVKNSAAYSNQFPITADSQGAWNGQLQVMVDTEDSGFTGSGDYIFKVRRYTQAGSDPTWSNNETTINITGNAAGSGSTSNSTPKSSSPASTKPSASANNSVSGSNSPKINRSLPDIAGISTQSSEPALIQSDKQQPQNKNSINLWFLGSGLLVFFSGAGVFTYFFLKQRNLIFFKKI